MNAIIDISNVILKTERLILRPWKETDLDDFYEYATVDGVGQMAGWLPHKNKEQTKMILDSFIKSANVFAIELDKKVIGSLGIDVYDHKTYPEFADLVGRELGFVLAKEYWGKGLMHEACMEVIKYLFDVVKLDFIVCSHFIENYQSARVQEKCGFKEYKNIKYQTSYGEVKDSIATLLKHEYWEK